MILRAFAQSFKGNPPSTQQYITVIITEIITFRNLSDQGQFCSAIFDRSVMLTLFELSFSLSLGLGL